MTYSLYGEQPPKVGFNPHPRMGGDRFVLFGLLMLCGFNPHPRMGGDRKALGLTWNGTSVSIHTPVWGVTYDVY